MGFAPRHVCAATLCATSEFDCCPLSGKSAAVSVAGAICAWRPALDLDMNLRWPLWSAFARSPLWRSGILLGIFGLLLAAHRYLAMEWPVLSLRAMERFLFWNDFPPQLEHLLFGFAMGWGGWLLVEYLAQLKAIPPATRFFRLSMITWWWIGLLSLRFLWSWHPVETTGAAVSGMLLSLCLWRGNVCLVWIRRHRHATALLIVLPCWLITDMGWELKELSTNPSLAHQSWIQLGVSLVGIFSAILALGGLRHSHTTFLDSVSLRG